MKKTWYVLLIALCILLGGVCAPCHRHGRARGAGSWTAPVASFGDLQKTSHFLFAG